MGNKKSKFDNENDEMPIPSLDEIQYNLDFVTTEYVNYTSIDAECFDTFQENMDSLTQQYNHIIDIALEFKLDSNTLNPRCMKLNPSMLRLSLDCNQCQRGKQPVQFNTFNGTAYCDGMCYHKTIKAQITKMESYINITSYLFIFSIALRYKPFFKSKGYGNHSLTGPVPKYGYCDIEFGIECKECELLQSNLKSVEVQLSDEIEIRHDYTGIAAKANPLLPTQFCQHIKFDKNEIDTWMKYRKIINETEMRKLLKYVLNDFPMAIIDILVSFAAGIC